MINITAITVCVNYSDYLNLVLPNKYIFKKWLIVTIPEDKQTIELCQRYSLDYCFSERIYENGPFCKGKAINDGILQLDPQPSDWLCVVDADTYLFPSIIEVLANTKLDKDYIYGLYGRVCVKDEDEFLQLLESNKDISDSLEHICLLAGFFQLWHSSIRPFYFEESTHAGLDDILMRDSYGHRTKFLPCYAIHIGELWINHKGRVNGV